MQLAWSRIWTRVAVSISYDDNHYTTSTSFISRYLLLGRSLREEEVKVLDCDFELQSCYYIYIWTNALRKCMNPFIHPVAKS